MQEFGAVDLDYVEIPYDHYIVDDWPDRRTHIHDSGMAVEKLVTDGTPVPVVASYGMTSGFTPPEGVTAPMLLLRPRPSARRRETSRARFSSSRPRPIPNRPTPIRSWTTSRRPTTNGVRRANGRRCSRRRRRASPVPIIAAGSGASSTDLPRSASKDTPPASSSSTTCRRAPRSGWRSAASTRRTARRDWARSTSTVPRSRSIASTGRRCWRTPRPERRPL